MKVRTLTIGLAVILLMSGTTFQTPTAFAVEACRDGIDNDGDGKIDFPDDPGCPTPLDDDETDPYIEQCHDKIDNDGDGLIDFLRDPGCGSSLDDNEGDDPLPACRNGRDDDGDGKTDYPDDPGCSNPADNEEFSIIFDSGGSGRGGGTTSGPREACRDGIDNDGDGKIDFPNDPGCPTPLDNDETDPVREQCRDGIDNDGDGLIDFLRDPGCGSSLDDNEGDDPVAACRDGIDNDGDGKTDYPDDPGCSNPADNEEFSIIFDGSSGGGGSGGGREFRGACRDGIDNDGDGKIDFPDDPGCTYSFDNNEADGRSYGNGGTSFSSRSSSTTTSTSRIGSSNSEFCTEGGDGTDYQYGALRLRKTVDLKEARPGDTIHFTITLTNTSNDPLYDIEVEDRFSTSQLVDVTASDNGTTENGKVRWVIAELSGNSTKTLTVTARVHPDLPHGATIRNFASAIDGNHTTASGGSSTTGVIRDLPQTGVDLSAWTSRSGRNITLQKVAPMASAPSTGGSAGATVGITTIVGIGAEVLRRRFFV
jgi:uncharacterized repeat protein (TIGR01451 family)